MVFSKPLASEKMPTREVLVEKLLHRLFLLRRKITDEWLRETLRILAVLSGREMVS